MHHFLTQNGDLLLSNSIIKILNGFIGPIAGVTLARFLVGNKMEDDKVKTKTIKIISKMFLLNGLNYK